MGTVELVVKRSRPVVELLEAMESALEAMEAGDYTDAFDTLEEICRAPENLLTPPVGVSLAGHRVFKELAEALPPFLAEPLTPYELELLAYGVSRITTVPADREPEYLLGIAASAADLGIILECVHD